MTITTPIASPEIITPVIMPPAFPEWMALMVNKLIGWSFSPSIDKVIFGTDILPSQHLGMWVPATKEIKIDVENIIQFQMLNEFKENIRLDCLVLVDIIRTVGHEIAHANGIAEEVLCDGQGMVLLERFFETYEVPKHMGGLTDMCSWRYTQPVGCIRKPDENGREWYSLRGLVHAVHFRQKRWSPYSILISEESEPIVITEAMVFEDGGFDTMVFTPTADRELIEGLLANGCMDTFGDDEVIDEEAVFMYVDENHEEEHVGLDDLVEPKDPDDLLTPDDFHPGDLPADHYIWNRVKPVPIPEPTVPAAVVIPTPDTTPSAVAYQAPVNAAAPVDVVAIRQVFFNILQRCHNHIINKCGWNADGTISNPSNILEPISIVDIEGWEMLKEVDGGDEFGRPVRKQVNGQLNGFVYTKSQLPTYVMYFEVMGRRVKRVLVPQNPAAVHTAGKPSDSARLAAEGNKISWVLNGDTTDAEIAEKKARGEKASKFMYRIVNQKIQILG